MTAFLRHLHLPLLLSILVVAGNGMAQSTPKNIPPDPTADPLLMAAGFLDAHPDLRFRQLGLEEYKKKNHEEAFRLFKRAGYYSDKPSQAIVGEMLWIGLGTEKNRPEAYVWMELAAERDYLSFSEKRDLYWKSLDENERIHALNLTAPIRAEYADQVAEPRLAAALRRERNKMTGSRLGSLTSSLQIVVPGVGTVDGSQYYAPKYWDPKEYRAWHDAYWKDLRIGRVNVGEVEQIGANIPPGQSAPVDHKEIKDPQP